MNRMAMYKMWLDEWHEQAKASALLPEETRQLFDDMLARRQAQAGIVVRGPSPVPSPLDDDAPSPNVKEDIGAYLQARKRGRVLRIPDVERSPVADHAPAVTS